MLKHGAEAAARSHPVSRRGFLKGTVVIGSALSGIPGILRAGQAPAYPKGTKLHLLQWLNFVPAGDKIFLAQAEEFGRQMGVEVQVERIGQNDVRTRAAAAIEAQSGPDIVLLMHNQPLLFRGGLADVTEVAEAIAKEQAGFYDLPRANVVYEGRWMAVPGFGSTSTWNYREDWLREAGFSKFPETWDQLREVGKKFKAAGHPIGQAFGHSENDPNDYCYNLLWGFGGMEVAEDGKTVVLDQKWTLEALQYNLALWKDAMDEGGLSWDDASNNRAFLAGSLGMTVNGPSIYIGAKDKFPEIAKAMNHALNPLGPAGRFYRVPTWSNAVMKHSKNQPLAKEFIRWVMEKPQYGKWFEVMEGFAVPPTKAWYDHPLWTSDPKLTVLRDVITFARHVGYAGPPGPKASEALAKFVIVDMFAKTLQGTSPSEALKWAAGELRRIYSA